MIPGLAILEGTKHQYPLYDALAMGVQMMVFTYLLGRTDSEGRTVIEMWADTEVEDPSSIVGSVHRRCRRHRKSALRRGFRAPSRHEAGGLGDRGADGSACSQACRTNPRSGLLLAEAIHEAGIDTVGLQFASNKVAATHPGSASPVPERDPSTGSSRGRWNRLDPLEGFLHAARTERLCILDRLKNGHGDIAVHHRDAVLRPAPVEFLELVEELLSYRIALVVLVHARPAHECLPHDGVDPSVLECGTGESRRIPIELLECRIHEDQTEAEACVNESLGVCFAKVPHSPTDVLRSLRNRLDTDDPNTRAVRKLFGNWST